MTASGFRSFGGTIIRSAPRPTNLVPRLIRAHRRKTAKRDLPEVAKIRRVTAAEAEFEARLLAKDRGEPRRESRWPKRSFAKRRTKNESHQRRET